MQDNTKKSNFHFLLLRKKNWQLFAPILYVIIMRFSQVVLSVLALGHYRTSKISMVYNDANISRSYVTNLSWLQTSETW